MSQLERLLANCLTIVLVACVLWLGVITLLMAAEALATGQILRTGRFAPRALRLVVAAACGVGLASGIAGTAAAEPSGQVRQLHLLDGLQLPDRVVGGPHLPEARHVTVTPGDSLWEIGERVDTEWQRLYRVNRAVVGSDPDLIQPGMRLVVPAPEAGEHR